MADHSRIHPSDDVRPPQSSAAISVKSFAEGPKAPNPPPSKPVPPPATYVVQLPREQILRYPPPENARKIQALKRAKSRRSCCRCCCCFVSCFLVLFLVAAAVSAGVLYLVFRFKAPKYAVTGVRVRGVNLTSAAPLSPAFDVTVRAENPNGKVGIYYLKGSAVSVVYDGVKLANGVLPKFYQPRKNVTVLKTALTGSDVVLGNAFRTALTAEQKHGRVPLVVRTEVPVKIKVGSVKTWEITVRVKCDVVLDRLSEKAKIVSHDCDYTVRLW